MKKEENEEEGEEIKIKKELPRLDRVVNAGTGSLNRNFRFFVFLLFLQFSYFLIFLIYL